MLEKRPFLRLNYSDGNSMSLYVYNKNPRTTVKLALPLTSIKTPS